MTDPKKSRRQILEEFVSKKPGDSFSRYGLAMECMNTGDTKSAGEQFRTLLQKDPAYVPAYLMYAQMLVRESRQDDARQILNAGISAASQKGDTHAQSELEALLTEIS